MKALTNQAPLRKPTLSYESKLRMMRATLALARSAARHKAANDHFDRWLILSARQP